MHCSLLRYIYLFVGEHLVCITLDVYLAIYTSIPPYNFFSQKFPVIKAFRLIEHHSTNTLQDMCAYTVNPKCIGKVVDHRKPPANDGFVTSTKRKRVHSALRI